MVRQAKIWAAVPFVLMAIQSVCAIAMRRSFALTAISDIFAACLMLSALAAFINLIKPFKNARQIFGRNAFACVLNSD